jgi:fumarate hydratase class II
MPDIRKETDILGVVELPVDKFWGDQTRRPLEVKHSHPCSVGRGSAVDWV